MGPFQENNLPGINLPPVTVTAPANTSGSVWTNILQNLPNYINAFLPQQPQQQPQQQDLLSNPLFLIVAGTAVILALKK
jgi:hypothetical protein